MSFSKPNFFGVFNISVSYPQKGYDSVHAIGRQIPDTIHTIKLKSGMEIPLGQIVMNEKPETKKAKKNHWGWYNNNQYIVDHDEFVTFDNSQASLR